MSVLCLDIATAPLPDAAKFLGEFTAPSNWKDPAKIEAEVERKRQAALAGAALDPDLARITAIGMAREEGEPAVMLCRYKPEEVSALAAIAEELDDPAAAAVTFGGLNFDLPMLERRALYLGVPFPRLNLDRYRSPHHDLCEILANRRPDRRRSLDFYVTRLGWAEELVKPLSGEEEAKVHETGKWELLRQSVERDVRAVRRLARWMGLMDQPLAEAGKEAR